ncbi:transcription antitermination [Trifolium pratense]|uniref:Transcription antitermination n=1 Tax=Trifolium pratense TaxID=57577 RepID=A0A2K3NG39_TRIPR|nr:transcription antitermination [Trifolium pratense]
MKRDFIIGGAFLGFIYLKKQIKKPKPIDEVDMEAIFKQAKVEQENADKAFEEEQKNAAVISSNPNSELESDVSKTIVDSKPKRGSRKTSNQLAVTEEASPAKKIPKLATGSTVRIISGTFLGFTGTLKKLSRKTKMATVHLTIFGKENIVDLDISEIAPETN